MTNEEFFRSLNYDDGYEVLEKTFRRFPMQYGTTLGRDGEPQLRPLEFKFLEDRKFYFDTVDSYESYREMREHPYVMVCIGDQESMSYVRLWGRVEFTRDPELVRKCFENSPVLTSQYGDHPEKVVAYYLTNAKAEFATFLPGLKNHNYDFSKGGEAYESRRAG